MNKPNDAPLTWTVVHTVFHQTAAVRINKSSRGFFTLEVGRSKTSPHGEPIFIRYFPLRFETQNGQVAQNASFPWDDVHTATEAAEDWVRTELQKHANENLERRIAKEERDANRGKTAPRGLRTLTRQDAENRKEKTGNG